MELGTLAEMIDVIHPVNCRVQAKHVNQFAHLPALCNTEVNLCSTSRSNAS